MEKEASQAPKEIMSNTSLSEFIQASAKLMLADRPDIWSDLDEALEDINIAFAEASSLDEDDDEEYSVHLSGYILTRIVLDEGVFEYTLSKKLVSFVVYTDEVESGTFDWTKKSKFVNVELGLPEILEEPLDIEPDISDDINYKDED